MTSAILLHFLLLLLEYGHRSGCNASEPFVSLITQHGINSTELDGVSHKAKNEHGDITSGPADDERKKRADETRGH